MNRRHILLITIMVSLALILLTGIQAYWVRSAVKVREAVFQRSVAEAIGDVMRNLEKTEITRQINKNREYNNLLKAIDSLDYLIYLETGKLPKNDGSSGFHYQRQQHWDEIFEDNQWKMVKRKDSALIEYPGENENLIENTELSERARQLNRKKAFLLNQVFDEMFNSPFAPNIENRVTYGLLDTLIYKALNSKGIKTEFEFGVLSEARKIMVVEKNPEIRAQLLEEGMFFPMFAGNGYGHSSDYLVLIFPNQTRYLFLQISGMLFISAGLMLLIIISFAVVIMAMIRQKKLSEMKNDFINNMTHEFKTPISTVSLACEVLNDPEVPKTEDLVHSYIDIISQENKRLGVLAEKILQTAILEKGQLNLRKDHINVHEVIADVIHKISIQVEIRDGSISFIPEASDPIIIADKIHITNVINNLLDNANKYTPKKPQIKVNTENINNGILISVSDNGTGISKASQKKIFDKLYRVPTGDVHNVKGFGLGLSYVKFIVEKHHGEVSVESEIEKGSIFRVWLPAGFDHD
ncbi:MAG: HAMP domain-containing histidine kinase [Lentimicrobium sp.]|nr:HAMP domain-containing histidine kinase [Lentimicrobium sp.]